LQPVHGNATAQHAEVKMSPQSQRNSAFFNDTANSERDDVLRTGSKI